MLQTIGVKTLDDLFKDVPAKLRFPKLNLPPALTEMEAAAELADIAASNESVRGVLGPRAQLSLSPSSRGF